ncbi:unnamed protein product [Mycena citricolor]|uniref:Uncharacterized protein n=1 Tax=Mycena citricolor TaxID=2018698 RepID=A0AAD2H636_9AGAR|nr:unnamed protein product [Mycena citricolor]
MGQFDLSLGCLLFSSWANMILLTLEIAQIYQYFQKYPKDNLFNKGSVIFALCSDLTTVFACLSVNYLYLVTHWGSNDYLLTQPWCIAVYVVSTAISSAITQTWLSRMVYNLTKQWIWLPIIWLFIVGGLTGAAATGGLLVIDASYAARAGLIKWVTLWLAGCVVADTVITVVLVAKFRTMKSTFQDTKSLLRRLSLEAVRNGSITTVMTIITLVIFTQQPGENCACFPARSASAFFMTRSSGCHDRDDDRARVHAVDAVQSQQPLHAHRRLPALGLAQGGRQQHASRPSNSDDAPHPAGRRDALPDRLGSHPDGRDAEGPRGGGELRRDVRSRSGRQDQDRRGVCRLLSWPALRRFDSLFTHVFHLSFPGWFLGWE